MQENLVIVESPAKAKTIEKFLGKEYMVKSSFGHIRDLSKKELGIDIDHNFEPHYEIPADKKKLVTELGKLAKSAKTVWLASDEDREGEAIAWHLAQVLGLDPQTTKRIVFHEITKNAILHAVENPRSINMNLVNAQQARRVLDRLVGFELSPVLWRKVKPSLSAGRVQSVAVRLIVEREREIIAFQSKDYYNVVAEFVVDTLEGPSTAFRAELNKRFATEQEAEAFLEACKTARFSVSKVEQKPSVKNPSAPFTTSTLQQEAGRKLGMSVSQTMSVAQRLYEAGYITYMRTDSVNLSAQALAAAKAEVTALFGEAYSQVRNYKTNSKGAQEAHEAIRPSYMDRRSIEGTPQEKRLYDLIWKRTVASQMASVQAERTLVYIAVEGQAEHFTATGEVIKFDGFLRLYSESVEDEPEKDTTLLPAMKMGDLLLANSVTSSQRFTQAPPRYSEASLVKRLEELGIGRPSTYAPTISTIITRGYVVKENRDGVKRNYAQMVLAKGKITRKTLSETVGKEKNKLSPTDIGMIVTDFLDTQFAEVMDYNFTASVEKQFDEIAMGEMSWPDMIRNFYGEFHNKVNEALDSKPVKSSQAHQLGVDPKSGKPVFVKIGRFGPVAQIGGGEGDEEKPRFASLKKGQLIATITLEEALALFELPRNLGEFEGKEVVIGVGRFGPYVRHDGKFVSLAKTDDPYTIELTRAIELIEQKRIKDQKMKEPIKTFAEEPAMQVLNGRYGPYIAFDGKNYRIPKGQVPEELTLEACREIIAKSNKNKK